MHRHLEGESRLEDDVHRAEVTEETTRNLRVQFVLDAVVRAEEIEVSQPELIEYIINASQEYGMDPNQFAQMLDQQGQVQALYVGDVARRKGLAEALAKAVLKDSEGNVLDMTAFTTPGGACPGRGGGRGRSGRSRRHRGDVRVGGDRRLAADSAETAEESADKE